MEQLIDSSLEIKSAPPVTKKRTRRTKVKPSKHKNEDHIDELVMIALQRFFDTPKHADMLWRQLGDHKSRHSISLRVIDWFVTNYCKKHAVHFKIANSERVCIVWQEYKQKLRGYSKQRFDPFCRHSRIRFHLGTDRAIVTTVGQLNFFRWAIENDILEYIQKHKDVIEKDMNETYQVHYSDRKRPDVKQSVDTKDNGEGEASGSGIDDSDKKQYRKKRREISKVANNGVCVFKIRA